MVLRVFRIAPPSKTLALGYMIELNHTIMLHEFGCQLKKKTSTLGDNVMVKIHIHSMESGL